MRKQLQWLDRAGPWMCIAAALVGIPALYFAHQIEINTVNQLGRYLCFAIVALGIDLIWGYTGMLSLCQALFFCMGAYAIGMHMALHGPMDIKNPDVPKCLAVVSSSVGGLSLPWFWVPFKSLPITLVLGLFLPGVAAAIFGYFAFRSRVRGVYFSIITQATTLGAWAVLQANQIFKIGLTETDFPTWFPHGLSQAILWFTDKLNQLKLCGTNGLTNFESLAGFDVRKPEIMLSLYILSVLMLIASYAFCRYLVQSKLGRVLVAVRDNESRLRFSGYQPVYFKVCAFTIAAVLAGLAGMLYCTQYTIIAPSDMRVEWSIIMVIWVAVGGRGTLTGAIAGTLLVNFMYSFLTSHMPQLWPFVQGGLFIGVVLFFPEGLIGIWRRLLGTQEGGKQPAAQSHGMKAAPVSVLTAQSTEVQA